jgi:hypothetical protein
MNLCVTVCVCARALAAQRQMLKSEASIAKLNQDIRLLQLREKEQACYIQRSPDDSLSLSRARALSPFLCCRSVPKVFQRHSLPLCQRHREYKRHGDKTRAIHCEQVAQRALKVHTT